LGARDDFGTGRGLETRKLVQACFVKQASRPNAPRTTETVSELPMSQK